MAENLYEIDSSTGTYSELPNTNFPASTDIGTQDTMSDLPITDSTLKAAATNYAIYIRNGNFTAANNLLTTYPELKNSIFTAEKYNWLHDAILALQNYYFQDVKELLSVLAANASGIDDTISDSSDSDYANSKAYSAGKINELLNSVQDKLNTVTTSNGVLNAKSGSDNSSIATAKAISQAIYYATHGKSGNDSGQADATPTANSLNVVTSGGVYSAINTATTNLNTAINNIQADSALSSTSTKPVQNKVINTALGKKLDTSSSGYIKNASITNNVITITKGNGTTSSLKVKADMGNVTGTLGVGNGGTGRTDLTYPSGGKVLTSNILSFSLSGTTLTITNS